MDRWRRIWGSRLAAWTAMHEAEQHFQRALELAPNLAEPHIFYGRWLIEKDRLAESQAQLEAAVRTNRLSLPARELLGQVYTREGNRQAATQLLEDTVRVTFNEDVARRYMAELAERQKRARAARYPDGLKPEELVNLSAKYLQQRELRRLPGGGPKGPGPPAGLRGGLQQHGGGLPADEALGRGHRGGPAGAPEQAELRRGQEQPGVGPVAEGQGSEMMLYCTLGRPFC